MELCNPFDDINYSPKKEIKRKIDEMYAFHGQFLQKLTSHENDLSSLASTFIEHVSLT